MDGDGIILPPVASSPSIPFHSPCAFRQGVAERAYLWAGFILQLILIAKWMVKAQNGDWQAEEVNKPYYKLTLK